MRPTRPLPVQRHLQAFFPPDDPESPWLLRLMILRDDLRYEIEHLGLQPESDSDAVWRMTYALRRATVSLLEAKSILAYEGARAAKRPADDVMRALAPFIQDSLATLEAAKGPLTRLPDALGAHVRPQNAAKSLPCVEATVLANYPNLKGTVRVLASTDENSYRGLTATAILFAWPNVIDDAKLEEKQLELRDAVLKSAAVVLRIADALLLRFWCKHGAVELPSDYELGVLDRTTGDRLVPV